MIYGGKYELFSSYRRTGRSRKSTIAKLLAKKMGYIYVDTGAMYRAMAVYFVQNNVNPDDEREINAAVTGVNITIEYMDGVQQVI